ncbi:sensor histidine kinase [Cellulomonas edaphi]|uniref:histidine kinase n=1 Tax=Cellulomonas edaphi TaxID=3053468 RepID=A0ABT7S4G7_9CELL|nr:ATP-binding protein [Cellulomons edaphi]MDM7830518.1 ATP-binding protein [Cellulomons edaphi]
MTSAAAHEVKNARPTRRPGRWWAGVPLVARLVGLITILLAVGLTLAGLVSATLLSRSLVAQVDEKLVTEGAQLGQMAVDPFAGGGAADTLPTDYYVQLTGESTATQWRARPTVMRTYGRPTVPTLTPAQADARAGVPYTVSSSKPGSRWRVVVYPVQVGSFVGVVYVALPLGDAHDTVEQMTLTLVLSGLGIVLLGGGIAALAVRRTLRPLREIETTAAAIAAGDLTQRVPAAPSSTEVGRLGDALNGMLTQIEQAFGARTASEARMRRFVADASHELRTPLATIRGYGELYRMGALTERDQVDDTMRRIEESATRMGGLVEDLLSLARLDEGRPLQSAPVDLTVLAADAVSDLHALDPSRSPRLVPLVDGGPSGPCLVLGDEARLRQVLANLVGNAAQHTPAGTAVEIAVGTDGARGIVEVRDHGPGIDPEHAARVFERFYRVDASRGRSSGGSGLGMAIVAAIVAAHHGSVELAETAGGGTTVRVALASAAPPAAD